MQYTKEQLAEILEQHKIWLDTLGEEGVMIDLYKADLSGANLEGADLREAELSDVNLEGANLAGAKLYKAYLIRANLSGARLVSAKFERARLFEANLTGADLSWADLYKVDLEGANLTRANLFEADLREADLSWTKLYQTNLEGAKMEGADLHGSDAHTPEEKHVYVLWRIEDEGLDFNYQQLGIFTSFEQAEAAGYSYIKHYELTDFKDDKFKSVYNDAPSWQIIKESSTCVFSINMIELDRKCWIPEDSV